MSEFKGTKGPWVTCDSHGPIEGGNNVMEVSSGRERWIASCCHYVSREEVRANASLISAAPELLEELQRMVAEYDSEIIDRYEGTRAFDSMLAVADKARAVIAKALGEVA